jgi:hypothetical protein
MLGLLKNAESNAEVSDPEISKVESIWRWMQVMGTQ